MQPYEKAFQSYGYRKMMKDGLARWMKPIGNTILMFREEHSELSNDFIGAQEQFCCWSREKIDINLPEEDFLKEIIRFEMFGTKTWVGPNNHTNFAFITPQERAERLCESL